MVLLKEEKLINNNNNNNNEIKRYLSLDVPPPPLFKSELEKNIIPQVSIYQLLDKFNGVTAQVLFSSLYNYYL